jgi:drug/metabolite transporter (DMT)-like permease
MPWTGETAGLITSVCWTCSSVAFTIASKRAGSIVVNHVRLWMAFLTVCAIHWIVFRSPFPFQAGHDRFFWLALSGLVGYTIGDSLLFESFVRIGPRLTMLMMTLSPIFAAVLARLFLGEHMTLFKMLAVVITVSGIAMVITESPNNEDGQRVEHHLSGVLLGIGAALCQAGGLLLSKIGMHGGYSPFSANVIRLTAATITIAIVAAFRGRLVSDVLKVRGDRKALAATLAATVSGPVLGVGFMLYSVTHTYVGIASTLMSLPPVLLLPVSHYLFHEKIGWRAIVGTLVSLLGVVLLF